VAYFRQVFKKPPTVYNHSTNMNTVQGPTRAPSPYSYTPNITISIIGTFLFCAATGYLVFQYLRTECWFLFAVIAGALRKSTLLDWRARLQLKISSLVETSGYAARSISVLDSTNATAFLIQYLVIM
jgi:hypothetical protein